MRNTYVTQKAEPSQKLFLFVFKRKRRSHPESFFSTLACLSSQQRNCMPIKPNIITASPEKWCESATKAIGSTVKSYIKTQGDCTLMLAGGNTTKKLYLHWIEANPWNHSKIKNYFGDERCVPPGHQDRNYGMVMSSLFQNGIPDGCSVTRKGGELSDCEKAVRFLTGCALRSEVPQEEYDVQKQWL